MSRMTNDPDVKPKVRDTAKVTVLEPVDGTVKRKKRGPDKGQRATVLDFHRKIRDPLIQAAVDAIVAEGVYTRVEIQDDGSVIVR
jgi:hypothetical protein